MAVIRVPSNPNMKKRKREKERDGRKEEKEGGREGDSQESSLLPRKLLSDEIGKKNVIASIFNMQNKLMQNRICMNSRR